MSLELTNSQYILEDLCLQITDGKHGDCENQENSGYYFVSVKDIDEGEIDYSNARQITKYDFEDTDKRTKLENEDILITNSGTIGKFVFVNSPLSRKTTFQKSVAIIKPDKNKILPKFLYYYLISEKRRLIEYAGGTTQKNLLLRDIRNFEVEIPNEIQQKKIINILNDIDQLIKVKKTLNKNLEQYLFYLFNEYFMEFDFNEFSNSNKTIPSSWKLGCFNDIIDSLGSGDWGKEEQTGNYISEVYCIRGADIPDVKQGNKGKMPIRFILPKNFEKRKLGENSIVIEISGGSPTQSTGRTVFITDNFLNRFDKDIICTNFCKVINPTNEYAIFLYLYLNYLYDKDVMFAYENGTTGIKNFDIKSFISNFEIVIPSIEDIIKFNNLVQNVFDVIMHNGLEIEQLQKLRDTLLPKLMSGDIDVSKINCDLE